MHHAPGGLCPGNFCSTARFALRILDAGCFLVLGSRAQASWWQQLGDGAPRGQHWLVDQPGQTDNTVTLATALLLSLLFFHLSSVTLLGLLIFHLFCLSLSPVCVSLSLSLSPLCVSEYAAVAGMWHVAGSGSGEETREMRTQRRKRRQWWRWGRRRFLCLILCLFVFVSLSFSLTVSLSLNLHACSVLTAIGAAVAARSGGIMQ